VSEYKEMAVTSKSLRLKKHQGGPAKSQEGLGGVLRFVRWKAGEETVLLVEKTGYPKKCECDRIPYFLKKTVVR